MTSALPKLIGTVLLGVAIGYAGVRLGFAHVSPSAPMIVSVASDAESPAPAPIASSDAASQSKPSDRAGDMCIISGRVRDTRANSIHDALVVLAPAKTSIENAAMLVREPAARTRSAADGSFRFEANRSDAAGRVVVARAPGYRAALREVAPSLDARIELPDLVLEPLAFVTVVASTEAGVPVENINFKLRHATPSEGRGPDRQAVSNPDGRATFVGVEPGGYLLMRSSEFDESKGKPIKIAGSDPAELPWLNPDLCIVSGRAWIDDAPAAGEDLTLMQGLVRVSTRTSPTGEFTFPPVAPGVYAARRGKVRGASWISEMRGSLPETRVLTLDEIAEVLADRSEGASSDTVPGIDVAPGANTRDLRFVTRGHVSIVVEDAATHAPLDGASVHLFDARLAVAVAKLARPLRYSAFINMQQPGLFNRIKDTDRRGTADFDGLAPAQYSIIVRKDNYISEPATLQFIDGATPPLTVSMNAGAVVSAHVVDSSGNAVASAWISRLSSRAEAFLPKANMFYFLPLEPTARANDRGEAELHGLDLEKDHVAVFAPGFTPRVVRAGDLATSKAISLPASGSLEIEVRDASGPVAGCAARPRLDRPVDGIPPELWDDFYCYRIVALPLLLSSGRTTDAEGRIWINSLPAGTWTITLTCGGTTKNIQATVVPGLTQRVPVKW